MISIEELFLSICLFAIIVSQIYLIWDNYKRKKEDKQRDLKVKSVIKEKMPSIIDAGLKGFNDDAGIDELRPKGRKSYCSYCGEINTRRGSKYCSNKCRRDDNKEKCAKHYHEKKNNNLCTRCGLRDVEGTGFVNCYDCRVKVAIDGDKVKKQKSPDVEWVETLDNGVETLLKGRAKECKNCGAKIPPYRHNRTLYCSNSCAKEGKSERRQILYQARKDAKLCVLCGANVRKGNTYCYKCKAKRKSEDRRRRARS